MYLFLFIFPILLILLIVNHFRKKKIIKKVNCMCTEDKLSLFDGIIEPFGYKYLPSQDLFSTRINSPQREFGYSALYDKGAPHINLIFDSLPVYFDYRGRTWLLEFWKGQYGINTGAEIGLYYTNRILDKDELKKTFFRAAEDADMLKMTLSLVRDECRVGEFSEKNWWVTLFRMGCFSQPADLSIRTGIIFPTCEMANAFISGLQNVDSAVKDIYRCCNTVAFTFNTSPTVPGFFRRVRVQLAQKSNQLFTKIYLYVTRPFDSSMDRLLYLYFYLPFAFRQTLGVSKKQRRDWRTARKRDANCAALANLREEVQNRTASTNRSHSSQKSGRR